MPHFFLMLITRSFRHALSSLLKRNMLSLGSTRADQSRTGNGCVCICAIETEGKEKINKHVRMGLGRPRVCPPYVKLTRQRKKPTGLAKFGLHPLQFELHTFILLGCGD